MNTAATAQAKHKSDKRCLFFMWFNGTEELPQIEAVVFSSIDEVIYIPTPDLVIH